MFTRLAQQHPSHIAVRLTFSTPLAQLIYAGSDMLLRPSRYEPCGLGQMIAMRYGSVPIVRATGGLADTVPDWNPRTGEGRGFAFRRYDAWDGFAAAVRALETYKYPRLWRQLQTAGMTADFSWERSASRYVALYRLALRQRRPAAAAMAAEA
jgi:starch synthase